MKRVFSRYPHQRLSAFTIVELIVVISVIAILAGITIIGYGAWRTDIAEKNLKSDMNNLISAMNSARNWANGYPVLPSGTKFDGNATTKNIFVSSEDSDITYNSGDSKGYCIDGAASASSSVFLFYNSETGGEPQKGSCDGGPGVAPSKATIFVYNTSLSGCSGTVQFPVTAPTSAPGYPIDWGDGSTSTLSGVLQSHTYATPGTYTVKYEGPITTIATMNVATANRGCLTGVSKWGANAKPTTVSFANSSQLVSVASIPSSVTNLSNLFYNATKFNQPIDSWDVSHVTSMTSAFYGATSFNQPLNSWDTSNVVSMVAMFNNANSFNQPIGNWNVSKVTSMNRMFSGAGKFNQSIDGWNTANVIDMSNMFTYALTFNQPLNSWNTSKVKNMEQMFQGATVFNQPLSSWNTSAVTNMSGMFSNARAFNQQISGWNLTNISKITSSYYSNGDWFNNGEGMFSGAYAFNNGQACGADSGPLWGSLRVAVLAAVFYSARCFNGQVGHWDTSTTTDMSGTFNYAEKFNQPLSGWNTSIVTSMYYMFSSAKVFNQDLSGWNVGSVTQRQYFDATTPAWTLPKPTWS